MTPDPAPASAPGWAPHLLDGCPLTAGDLRAGGSLPGAWLRHWDAHPASPVLRDAGSSQWLTAGELEAASRAVAGRLSAAGVRAGDRVLLSAEPSVALIVAYCGVLRSGAVLVPVNTAYQARELAHVVADAEPSLAIVGSDELVARLRSVAPGLALTDVTVDLPEGRGANLDAVSGADPALICYTSGTTGAPKGAVLRHGNLLASAHAVRIAWRWTPDDELMLALPLFHMHGLGVGVNGTLVSGARAVVHPRFDPLELFAEPATCSGAPTMFFGVPTMYQRLVDSQTAERLAPLRLCVSGSAPLPESLHEAVERASGQRILERYGMTETVMNVSHPYDGERRPGTVGYPLPGVELRVAAERGGEIELRGPNVFGGYWRNDGATEETFTSDGWFKTGDLGRIEADGQLRIVGRAKELIISGGYNVYPREVEEVLRTIAGVEDAAVVGVPSAAWGEMVVAFVVARSALDLDEVRRLAALELAPYKRPKHIRQVAALPRNALGKVLRAELQAHAGDLSER